MHPMRGSMVAPTALDCSLLSLLTSMQNFNTSPCFPLMCVFCMFLLACVSAEVMYTRTTVPSGWMKGAAAPADAKVEFTLALRQRNLDILEKWFWEVSDPQHANYQDFKTIDELRDLTSPTTSEHAQIWTWLHSSGIHHSTVQSFGDSMDVTTTVAKAEKMFNTKFFVYTHMSVFASKRSIFDLTLTFLEPSNRRALSQGMSKSSVTDVACFAFYDAFVFPWKLAGRLRRRSCASSELTPSRTLFPSWSTWSLVCPPSPSLT
jgi:hypothetical protein